MFKKYTPNTEELEMVKLKKFLNFNQHASDDQDELCASLVHAITNFNFNYQTEESPSTWEIYEQRRDWIEEKLPLIKDDFVRGYLQSHFNENKCEEVMNLFSWGKYVNKSTQYVRLRWEGKTHNEARDIVGLTTWLMKISAMVEDKGVQNKVLYSNNVPLATHALREGMNWFDDVTRLSPIAVPNVLWVELSYLAYMYLNNKISFISIKNALKEKAEIMLTEKMEIIKLNNFYIALTHIK